MTKSFIDRRIEKWRRLEEFLGRLSSFRLSSLRKEEVRELAVLYRRTAADLAIAHEEIRSPRLINYLNNLVIRTHGAIYRTEKSGFKSIWEFYKWKAPAVVRQTWKATTLAAAIFVAAACFAGIACWKDESFADLVAPRLREQIVAHRNWTEGIKGIGEVASSSILTNNIRVAFNAFAGGLTFGLFTLYTVLFNGMLLGVVVSLCVKHRFFDILYFVSGHGVIELSAIFLAAGGGFLLCAGVLLPGDLPRGQALRRNGLAAVQLVMLIIPMLVFAGIIEGFVSPSDLAPRYKIALSAITAVLFGLYVAKRPKPNTESQNH